MKLIRRDKVILQGYEVMFILSKMNHVPGKILEEIYADRQVPISGADKYQFGYEFSNPENVEWLSAQSWILDYDEYRSVPVPELRTIAVRLKSELYNMVERNSQQQVTTEFDAELFRKKRHILESIELMIHYRQKEIRFELPNDTSKPRVLKLLETIRTFFHRSAP